MLHIFYGRENKNKDQFLFDSIKGRTLLLVPDQFTLQAERDAFFYLGTKGLMDLEVVSISRLGMKVLAETGGGRCPMIDKYGRHMLLTKILREKKEALGIYRGQEKKQSFIEMMNNFISELKQYGVDPDALDRIAQELSESAFLRKKLQDVSIIFRSYEKQIQGKYLDTEDYVDQYAEKITQSQMVKNSRIWIYGFDSFTPKNTEVIRQLMKTAPQVHLIMTGSTEGRDQDVFSLTQNWIRRFTEIAEEEGVAWEVGEIPDAYIIKNKKKGILGIEQELYALPAEPIANTEGITLVKAANYYSEAESAAEKVLSLVRDQGMAYRDLILICNDMEVRGTIIKRVFSQYGLELFLDKKQNILHSPFSVFLLSLLELSGRGYGTESIFRFLKTGLTDLSWEEVEELENYARKYRIRGNRWTAPFSKGEEEYGLEALQNLESGRQKVVSFVEPFRTEFQKAGTVKERVAVLYRYLTDVYQIPAKLEVMIREQEEEGLLNAAGETAQVWGLVMDVLDQFVEVVGDETILAESFGDILRSGLESIEVGLLPPSADGLILGTMQRTRSSRVRGMLILGANEGVLPASAGMDSILSEDEKRFLFEREIEICKVDEIRVQEEKLAIYKNLSKPSECLWMSYSVSDSEGKELKPSPVFRKLQEICAELECRQDIVSSGDAWELLQAEDSTMEHLTAALRESMDGGALDPVWKEALSWYQGKGKLTQLREGLFFTNKQEALSRELVEAIYKREMTKELSVSPSRLERYSRCPFSHFIDYGLRPEEQRVFEIGGRELGDLYHTCLMELSAWLTQEGVSVDAPESRWQTVSRQECEEKVREILERQAGEYREGLFSSGKEESYRTRRAAAICSEISWILIEHVRQGKVKSISFEQEFGRGKALEPVTVKTGQGDVLIEGKIDRVDVLRDGRVKIIDYKTGAEKFDLNEVRKGFRLQLMLYLQAAQGVDRQPAGVFYFLIREPSVSAESFSPEELEDKVEQAVKRGCKMDGVMVDDPQVIEEIAGDFTGFSDIIAVRRTQKGVSAPGGALMEEETFHELQKTVEEKVKELCEGLLSGEIVIRPKRSGTNSACTWCKYKGICQFDPVFEDCGYEII